MSFQNCAMPAGCPYAFYHSFAHPHHFDPVAVDDYVVDSESGEYVFDFPLIHSSESRFKDLKELYRRSKPLCGVVSNSGSSYHPNKFYMPTECLYDPRPGPSIRHATHRTLPQRSSSAYAESPTACRIAHKPDDHQCCQSNNFSCYDFDAASFRSSPQIGSSSNNCQDRRRRSSTNRTRNAHQKKYPVTFRATRYVKRPSAVFLPKPPSAVCVSSTYHLDSIVNHQNNHQQKQSQSTSLHQCENSYNSSVVVGPGKTMKTVISPLRPAAIRLPTSNYSCNVKHVESEILTGMDSKGEGLNETPVDDKMSNIERLVASLNEEEFDNVNEEHKMEIARMSKYLKPRIPNSIKHQQKKLASLRKNLENAQKLTSKVLEENQDSVIFKETQLNPLINESLDVLFGQLKKCELAGNLNSIDDLDFSKLNVTSQKNSSEPEEEEIPQTSFNYEDMTNSLNKDKTANISLDFDNNPPNTTACASIDGNEEVLNSQFDLKTKSATVLPSRPPLDDNCALELHKSKSYIVNLIDRALSKELGTVPEKMCCKKEFDCMHPKRAINLMNRHCNEICTEISHALGKSKSDPTSQITTESKNSQTSFSGEEPEYIRQLKNLRWGHFKHIQQEVRRLEDLERFLDNCEQGSVNQLL